MSENHPLLLRSGAAGITRQRSINLWICYGSNFLDNIGFAIVIASLWPFLHSQGADKTFLGIVVAMFSVGQFVGSPVLGWYCTRRSHKEAVIVSLLFGLIGNGLYAMAPNQYVILASRFVIGFRAGNSAVLQSYAAHVTSIDERTVVMSNLGFALTLGWIVGPAMGAGLSFVDFDIWHFPVDALTAPGYSSFLLALINLIAVVFFFKETQSTPTTVHDTATSTSGSLSRENTEEEPLAAKRYSLNEDAGVNSREGIRKDRNSDFGGRRVALPPVAWRGILPIIIIAMFLSTNTLAVYETISTPLTEQNYGFGVRENSLLWIGISTVSAVGFFALSKLGKRFSDGKLLFTSFAMLFIGLVQLIEFVPRKALPLPQYIVGTCAIAFSYPIGNVLLVAVFSKVLGSSKQGTLLGILNGGGSLARIVGPLWAGAALEYSGENAVFAATAGGVFVAALLLAGIWKPAQAAIRLNAITGKS